MKQLEGYSQVAVVKYGAKPYYFAIYDDGNKYQVGDLAVFSGSSNPSNIAEIITPEEAKRRYSVGITAEVIGKVDISAYEKRVEQRKRKEELKKELDKRKKEIREKLDDEYYASKDETYAAMLREYEILKGDLHEND